MDRHLLQDYCVLVTDDQDRSAEVVGRILEQHSVEPRSRTYGIRWHQASLHRCGLAYIDHSCAAHVRYKEPLRESFRLLLMRQGQIHHRLNGRAAEANPAMAVLHAPGQNLDLRIEHSRMLLLSIDGGFVRRALARRFGTLPPFETWAAAFPLDAPAVAALSSFCEWIARELDRPESLLRSQRQMIDNVERALLAFFIDLLASRHPSPAASSADVVERRLAQIRDWVEEHLGEPIGTAELAAAADVSARSVEHAFRRRLGCTPMQFVLQRRLERAHELLQEPELETTVTDVAIECGVFQLGRFAARYRSRFGENPSQTLGRSRAALGLGDQPILPG